MDNPFLFLRYSQEEHNYVDFLKGGKNYDLGKSWFRNDTINAWRQNRMYQTIDPFLNAYSNQKWLTIGDGRYGSDANYIKKKGISVLATDISDSLLDYAKEIGFIDEYKKENAESLSFKDDEFDFVFCKEAFHHFPRPIIALYEMCRVAKMGVLLIEPVDSRINDIWYMHSFRQGFRIIKNDFLSLIKLLIRDNPNKKGQIFIADPDYEEVGNFIYTISKRELEKIAIGLNFCSIAFKTFNDFYEPGIEFEIASENSKSFNQLKKRILRQDLEGQENLMLAVLLKIKTSDSITNELLKNGFQIVMLPKNPTV